MVKGWKLNQGLRGGQMSAHTHSQLFEGKSNQLVLPCLFFFSLNVRSLKVPLDSLFSSIAVHLFHSSHFPPLILPPYLHSLLDSEVTHIQSKETPRLTHTLPFCPLSLSSVL